MKKLSLAIALLLSCLLSQAQNQNTPHPNWGSFYIIQNTSKGEERFNVNYQLSPVQVYNKLDLFLDTPEPTMMSVKLLNINSETLISWRPAQKDRRYNHSFDISNLAPGPYKIEIYGPDAKKVQTLNFTKQNGSATSN